MSSQSIKSIIIEYEEYERLKKIENQFEELQKKHFESKANKTYTFYSYNYILTFHKPKVWYNTA